MKADAKWKCDGCGNPNILANFCPDDCPEKLRFGARSSMKMAEPKPSAGEPLSVEERMAGAIQALAAHAGIQLSVLERIADALDRELNALEGCRELMEEVRNDLPR